MCLRWNSHHFDWSAFWWLCRHGWWHWTLDEYNWLIFKPEDSVNYFFNRLFEKGISDLSAISNWRPLDLLPPRNSKSTDWITTACLSSIKRKILSKKWDRLLSKQGIRFWFPVPKWQEASFRKDWNPWGAMWTLLKRIQRILTRWRKASWNLENKVDVVTFTSSSTVYNFMDQLDGRTELWKGSSLHALGLLQLIHAISWSRMFLMFTQLTAPLDPLFEKGVH